jgi:hypothetical protein
MMIGFSHLQYLKESKVSPGLHHLLHHVAITKVDDRYRRRLGLGRPRRSLVEWELVGLWHRSVGGSLLCLSICIHEQRKR